MRISKWFFKDFSRDISNLYFRKTLDFLAYSDLESTNYEVIGKILDTIGFDKNTLVSLGKKQSPFGVTVDIEDDETLNILLNSCRYAFVMTPKMDETNYILQTVLAGIIPICNLNHIYIKKLHLCQFATLNDYDNILDKLCEIRYNQKISEYKVSLLSWKYKNKLKKWNKKYV